MKKVLFALFVAFGVVRCPQDTHAAPVFGRDFYAVQSKAWNVTASTKFSFSPMALGSLDGTFGVQLGPVDTVINALHPIYYRVHIINAVCIRNSNCGSYEIGHGYSKASFDVAVGKKDPRILNPFKARVAAYRDLAKKYPGTKFIVSPALEHDLSIKSWRVLANATVGVWPGVQLSNSPDGGVSIERYLGAWIERHGNSPQSDSDIVSLDGSDATQIDIAAFVNRVNRLPHVQFAQLWTAGDNCRASEWQDPRARTACPSSKTFELMSHIIDPLPVAPRFTGSQCKKIIPFKDPDIWKPLAETHVHYDPRQELPVTIFKGFSGQDLTVLSSGGNIVGSLGYYGSYLSQGLRWYSGYRAGSKSSGYELQKGAQAVSGSPWVWLQQRGTCKGPLITGRRFGLMRDK